ncbi:MAG: hypothetical protein HOV68_15615 [Streptomycetaceae bacterium]|nr:hypothetical protein [Streptomycetaceae bacterium]
MTAPIRDIAALDVPLADVEAHMAEQRRIAILLAARVTAPAYAESDRIAYALDVRLIETHAKVATDADYPQWASELASRSTYFRAEEATA